MRRLPPAVLVFVVLLALFLLIDLAAWCGVIPGGTFSHWVRGQRWWTLPAYVAAAGLLGWHLFGRGRA
jgi:hypothetical protein